MDSSSRDKSPPQQDHEDRRCPRCNAPSPWLATLLDIHKGKTVRIFKCGECGNLTWDDLGRLS